MLGAGRAFLWMASSPQWCNITRKEGGTGGFQERTRWKQFSRFVRQRLEWRALAALMAGLSRRKLDLTRDSRSAGEGNSPLRGISSLTDHRMQLHIENRKGNSKRGNACVLEMKGTRLIWQRAHR